VKSPAYAAARDFVVAGNEAFNRESVRLDSRYLPHSEELQRRFGKFFNLIYVRSNEAGRVVAHFTLYNVISWRIVLAEAGGTPNVRIGLVSNPLDPVTWSDTIADEINIDFAWLDNPDYSDQFQRARERLIAAMQQHVDMARSREVNRIVTEVFEKYGIVGEHTPVTDPEVWKKIILEASRRVAAHALRLPYVEEVPGEDIVARLKAARAKPDDDAS
jgi:hypothetical protein